MPASNQLLDHSMVETEVSLGNLLWKTTDTAQTTNMIYDWAKYKAQIATSGTTQFADNYCPTYQNMLDYRIINVTQPQFVSSIDQSFCDSGTPVYKFQTTLNRGTTSYPIQVDYSTDNSNWFIFSIISAGTGQVSTNGTVDSYGSYFLRAYHTSNGTKISNYATTTVNINQKFCF